MAAARAGACSSLSMIRRDARCATPSCAHGACASRNDLLRIGARSVECARRSRIASTLSPQNASDGANCRHCTAFTVNKQVGMGLSRKLLQKKRDRPRPNYLECAVTFRVDAAHKASWAGVTRKGDERFTLRRRAEFARHVAGRGRCRPRYGTALGARRRHMPHWRHDAMIEIYARLPRSRGANERANHSSHAYH
jgi:hypothetical protein